MSGKLKTVVFLNHGGCDIDLELTSDQAVMLLDRITEGESTLINLKTPKNGHVREDPKAYAQP